MPLAAVNTDLPTSWKIPGVYTQINFTGSGAAVDDASKRVLLMAYASTTATAPFNTPVLYNQQSDVNDYFVRGSDMSRLFAAFQSQNGPGTAEIYCCSIQEPSGGTAATYTVTVAGPATEAGSLSCWVCGYRASIAISNGDTATQVATRLYNELALLLDLPVTFTDGGSGTLTFTYRHKGVVGNDLPVMFDQTDASGITVSPGKVTLTGNPSGSGNVVLVVGATTITSAIDSAVQTTATLAATKVAGDINAGNYPVQATDNLDGSFTLRYRNARAVRRISVSDTVATTTSAVSLHGTSGAGFPTLTTAITNIEAMATGFAGWVTPFIDGTATSGTGSSTDAIYDSVLVQENGLNQKGPMVFLGSPAALTTADDVVTDPAPDLTASPRFTVAWCREAPQQAWEIAARYAAIYVQSDYGPKNLDGSVLKTRGSVPLLAPDINDWPSQADQNSALGTYFLTPIVMNSRDELVVLRARTTSNAANQDLHEVSTIRQMDLARPSLNQRLITLFSGKSYRTSTPKTPNTVTTTSVRDAVYVWTREQDDQDLFDNAAAWKDAIQVNVNGSVNTRFDIYVPFPLIRNLHQLGVVIGPQ